MLYQTDFVTFPLDADRMEHDEVSLIFRAHSSAGRALTTGGESPSWRRFGPGTLISRDVMKLRLFVTANFSLQSENLGISK